MKEGEISCGTYIQWIIVQPLKVRKQSFLEIWKDLICHNEWGKSEKKIAYYCIYVDSRKMVQLTQFSRSVMSDSLRPYGLQHTRLPCPWPTPGACSNSFPSSWWGHPTISFSAVSFSSRFQSFLESGSFSMSRLFTSGGQNNGVSVSASVLPMNIQYWFSLG